jgi:hypothetical protein
MALPGDPALAMAVKADANFFRIKMCGCFFVLSRG